MATNVEVKKSGIDNAGRGLFAKKNFEPGEIVLALDRPYVAELDTERLHDTCAWCFQRGTSPEDRAKAAALGLPSAGIETKQCTGCKRVRYCSKTCQTRAWKREHKYECKILAPAERPDLPHGVRAVVKLLGRLKADAEGKDELLLDIIQFKPASDSKALEDIKHQDSQRFEDFSMLAYGAWKYSGEPKIGDMDSNAISKAFFFNLMSNTLQLSSAIDDTKLGVGFDPILCSANHSCEPNTAVIFNQPKILLRAQTKIKKGDEIFMKYVDITNPFSVRQAELRESYFFGCRCAKCRKGAVHIEDKFLKSADAWGDDSGPTVRVDAALTKVADGLIQRHQSQLPKFYVPANSETAQKRLAAMQAEAFATSGITFDHNKANDTASEDEIKDALKLTINSGMWHITRQPVPHLLRQLLVLYVSQARTYQAWRVGIKMYYDVSPFLSGQVEKFYPDRVIDGFLMATITNQLCNPNIQNHREIFAESLKSGLDLRVVYMMFLIETREMLDFSYGKDSPFGRVVESMYQQTMANSDILLKDAKDMIDETWPKLEAVAKSIDVLKL
ncbi:putative SET domain, Zinc finger, MYND-type, 4Fe-4S ferredoxin-type, iron-sulfur binding protein [Septoria linicola]|nr:putative SET domain, Zinc finger, MYND-type, 4Fe-4S ferredoxin-type, iron-sulfur binding protein [Septoria linicola]